MTLVCACGGASKRHKDFDAESQSELEAHTGSLDWFEGRAVAGRPRHLLARVSDALSGRMWLHPYLGPATMGAMWVCSTLRG